MNKHTLGIQSPASSLHHKRGLGKPPGSWTRRDASRNSCVLAEGRGHRDPGDAANQTQSLFSQARQRAAHPSLPAFPNHTAPGMGMTPPELLPEPPPRDKLPPLSPQKRQPGVTGVTQKPAAKRISQPKGPNSEGRERAALGRHTGARAALQTGLPPQTPGPVHTRGSAQTTRVSAGHGGRKFAQALAEWPQSCGAPIRQGWHTNAGNSKATPVCASKQS